MGVDAFGTVEVAVIVSGVQVHPWVPELSARQPDFQVMPEAAGLVVPYLETPWKGLVVFSAFCVNGADADSATAGEQPVDSAATRTLHKVPATGRGYLRSRLGMIPWFLAGAEQERFGFVVCPQRADEDSAGVLRDPGSVDAAPGTVPHVRGQVFAVERPTIQAADPVHALAHLSALPGWWPAVHVRHQPAERVVCDVGEQ